MMFLPNLEAEVIKIDPPMYFLMEKSYNVRGMVAQGVDTESLKVRTSSLWIGNGYFNVP